MNQIYKNQLLYYLYSILSNLLLFSNKLPIIAL